VASGDGREGGGVVDRVDVYVDLSTGHGEASGVGGDKGWVVGSVGNGFSKSGMEGIPERHWDFSSLRCLSSEACLARAAFETILERPRRCIP
jgi:hypothetical protein